MTMGANPSRMLKGSRRPRETLARWSDLAADAAEANVFYAPELLVPALDHLGGNTPICVLEAHEGGRLIGLLPVVAQRTHGRLPFANVANWMHRHCFYGVPLLRRGHEEAAWHNLLAQLDKAVWARGFLHIAGMDPAGPAAASLTSVCLSQRRASKEIARFGRAMLNSSLSADAYLDGHVSASTRKQISRKQKGLCDIGTLATEQLTDPVTLPGWCSAFLALEQAGWKGRNGTALASNVQDARFFRAAMSAAMASGKLHGLRLTLDGAPIAMLVNFRHGDGSFAFKSTYDESYGRFSPGFLLEVESLIAVQNGHVAAWMDSCTASDNMMIQNLWAGQRSIAQFRVALDGPGRRVLFTLANAAEQVSRRLKASQVVAKSGGFLYGLVAAMFFAQDTEPGPLLLRTTLWGSI